MAKTEVILTHNIVGLGGESDHVKVAAGYARNYLFPQGYAIPLTHANKRRVESLKQRRAQREADELNHMTELSRSLGKLTAVITVKTGEDGKMFGSVTSGAIVDQLKHQFDVALDKKKIHLEHPIRTLGEHEVELRLHEGVVTKLKVLVESSTPLPKPAEEAPSAQRHDGERTEKRGKRPERARTAESAPAAEHKAAADKPEHADRKARPARTEKSPKAAKSEKTEKSEKA